MGAKLHGYNAVNISLIQESLRKHPTFPVSGLEHYKTGNMYIRKNVSQNINIIVPFEEET